MGFVDHLSSLAEGGETLLVVHQKPVLRNGEHQLHGDGAIKCVWPAFLPARYTPARAAMGDAWYANTGAFIVDRFPDGKPRAGAAFCEYVLVMVLDDIGTKAKVPPLEPTWKMETSPGNYQWGYVFSEQPRAEAFAAAIVAIADAGYTDRGATNPVRNFRLPGSVNIKPGRGGFASLLTEFHPDREFTLAGICAALGVTPGEASSRGGLGARSPTLADDGLDDVLAWLTAEGLILDRGNASGWWGVICPNEAEHSDGNPEGRYLPANRAYTCLHEHCGDWNSERFLAWVADEGGPDQSPGLRSELLAATMAVVLAKLTPGDLFRDDPAAQLADIERRELGRVEKDAWYTRFAYNQDDENYFDLTTRREVSRSTFNALYRHITCLSRHAVGKGSRKIEASVCFDENREDRGALALVGITYAAGDDVVVFRDGDAFGNRWRDARPDVSGASGSAQPWLDHCAALIPNVAEREHVLDVMAFKTQFPGRKINHAVLHAGDEGCGKDTMWAPFLWAVCGPALRNRGMMDNDTISSQWGYQLESEVLVINELREPDAGDRRAFANRLKPIIAAPPEMLPINRKGLAPYNMVNRVFVLAFSNDPLSISLASQDRRWFCVWSHAPRMSVVAAADMWTWYSNGGFESIAAWLLARDVSALNVSAAPMMTEFKENLIEHSRSGAESFLVGMMLSRAGEFARGVVGSPFHALCDRLAGAAPTGMKIPPAALLHAFVEAGWIDCGRVHSAEHPSKKHVFCAPGLDIQMTKSELRREAEPVMSTLGRMSVVK